MFFETSLVMITMVFTIAIWWDANPAIKRNSVINNSFVKQAQIVSEYTSEIN